MPQDNRSGNGLRFGHAVCMQHTDGHLIALWFADSEEIADEAVAKLQHYHDQQPQIGNTGDDVEGSSRRREQLRMWRLHHPVGDNRSYDVAGFKRLSLPFLNAAKIAALGKLP